MAVVAVHRVRATIECAPHEAGFELNRVAVDNLQDLAGAREGDGAVARGKKRNDIGPQRHLGGEHGDSGRDGRHVVVVVMLRWRGSTAKRELEHVGREWPRARRLAAQHDLSPRLTRGDASLGRDEDDEFVERDRWEDGAAVLDGAKLHQRVHLGRHGPGDVAAGPQAAQKCDGGEPCMAVGGDVDRERAWWAGELDAPSRSRDAGRGDELDAVQIVAWTEGGGWVTGSPLRPAHAPP